MSKPHKRTYTHLWTPSTVHVNGSKGEIVVECEAGPQKSLLRLELDAMDAQRWVTAILRGLRKLKASYEYSARFVERCAVDAIEEAKTDPPKGSN